MTRPSSFLVLVIGFLAAVSSESSMGQYTSHTYGTINYKYGKVEVLIEGTELGAWRYELHHGGREEVWRWLSGQEANTKMGLFPFHSPRSFHRIVFRPVPGFVTPKPVTFRIKKVEKGPRPNVTVRGRYRPIPKVVSVTPLKLTDVYEPESTYTRCFPTHVGFDIEFPVPEGFQETKIKRILFDGIEGLDSVSAAEGREGSYNARYKGTVALSATGNQINESETRRGVAFYLLSFFREKFNCNLETVKDEGCTLSVEQYEKASSLIKNPETLKPTWGAIYGERETEYWTKGEEDGLKLLSTYERLAHDTLPGSPLSQIDVCGASSVVKKASSESAVTLAGQGQTQSDPKTSYIEVDQQLKKCFYTPISEDETKALNDDRKCNPNPGVSDWKTGEAKDVTTLVNYMFVKHKEEKCDLPGFTFLSPGAVLYDIAAPIVVGKYRGVKAGKHIWNSHSLTGRKFDLEDNVAKYWVKVN